MFDFEALDMDVSSDRGSSTPPRLDLPRGTLFESSPSLVASEVTGGVRGNDGVRVCLIRSVDDVCGGEIKGGGSVVRFCSKPRDQCGIASHAKSKVNLKAGTLYPYVPKKGVNQVRLAPSMHISLLPPNEAIEDLLAEQKTVALWRTYMEACQASELSTGRNEFGLLSDDEDIRNWEAHLETPSLRALENAADFKTPKKVRVISGMVKEELDDYVEVEEIGTVSPLNIDITNWSPLEGDKKTIGNMAVRKVVSEWDGLSKKFGMLTTRFLSHEVLTGKSKEDMVSQFEECNYYMNDLGNKSRLLASLIGEDDRSEQAETSVWESLNLLQEEVSQGQDKMKEIQDGLGNLLGLEEKEVIASMGKNLEKLAKAFKKSMTAINSRLVSVEVKVSKLLKDDQAADYEFNPMSGPDASSQSDVDGRLTKIQERVRVLEGKATTQETANEEGGQLGGGSQAYQGMMPQPGVDSASHESMMDRLEILESRSTGDTCVFGGFNFTSLHDVVAFVTKYSVPTCALYWDLLSAMVCMRSKGETGKEQSERKYAAHKANVHSALEADLVASMGHERPMCLYSKDKKELSTLDKGFAACSSYKLWMSGGTQSYWYQLDYDFKMFCQGLTGRISARGRNLSNGDLLAQVLITAMGAHFVKLIAFINEFYRELVDVAKFREEKAWILVGQCVACIFETMRPFRSEVTLIEDATPVQNKSAFIWAVFQSHRVMDEFILVGFKGHPAIVKQMSLFMVTERVDPSEIVGMMNKVVKAETAADKATAESKRLTEANAVLKRKVDALAENFETFKKKVNQKIF